MSQDRAAHRAHSVQGCPWCEAFASDNEPPIDVERLARAISAGLYMSDADDPTPREAAEAIAREYARLGDPA